MHQVRIAVCVYTTNAAEVIRAVEIARAAADGSHRRRGSHLIPKDEERSDRTQANDGTQTNDEEMVIRFFTYRGNRPGQPPRSVDFEHIIRDAGFDVECFGTEGIQPILDDDMWKALLQAERHRMGMFPPPYEECAAQFIRAIMHTLGEFRPDAVLYGAFPEVAVACAIRGWKTVSFKTLPLDAFREWAQKRHDVGVGIDQKLEASKKLKKQQRDPWKVIREAAVEFGLQLSPPPTGAPGGINAAYFEATRPKRTIVCDFESFYEGATLPSDVIVVGPIVSSDGNKSKEVETIERFLGNNDGCGGAPIKVLLTMGSTGEPTAFLEGVKALCLAERGAFRSVVLVPKVLQECSEVKSILQSAMSNADIYTVNKFIPVRPLMQLVDVVLCHGGQLTIQCALSAGVPIVGCAAHAEQLYNLENVERSGAGRHVPSADWRADTVRILLLQVGGCTSAYKKAALRMQREILNGKNGLERAGTVVLEVANCDAPSEEIGMGGRSIVARQASMQSRILALSSTSKVFQDRHILPMKVSAMIFLENPKPDVDRLRRILADGLLEVPRFRCAVRSGHHGSVILQPLDRSDLKVEDLIAHVDNDGNEFGRDKVQALINEAYLEKWHADMPLWRMKIVTNIEAERSLVFASIDHALGDGVGLLSVLLPLFDNDSSGTTPNPMLRGEKRRPKGLSPSHRALAILKGLWAGVVITLLGAPIDIPHSLMIPKSQLSEPSLGKDFAQTRAFSLDEVKMMKNKLDGATVNDVIIALFAMAITKYLEQAGDEVIGFIRRGKGAIRASFPVNMHQVKGGLGNDFVLGYISLPVDYSDPVDCVWRAKTKLDEVKLSPYFTIYRAIAHAVFRAAPAFLVSGKLLDLYTRTTCSISNVIGPGGAASIGGYPIDDISFTVSYPGNLFLGVISFNGKLRISGVLDRKTGGDLIQLMARFEDSYDELKAVLEGVDEKEPLARPNSTPLSATILGLLLLCIVLIALPLLAASSLKSFVGG